MCAIISHRTVGRETCSSGVETDLVTLTLRLARSAPGSRLAKLPFTVLGTHPAMGHYACGSPLQGPWPLSLYAHHQGHQVLILEPHEHLTPQIPQGLCRQTASTLQLRQDRQWQAFFQGFPTVPNQPEVSSCCEPRPPARQNEYAYMLIRIAYNLHNNQRPILQLRSGFQRQLRSALKAACRGVMETLHPRAPGRMAPSLESSQGEKLKGQKGQAGGAV